MDFGIQCTLLLFIEFCSFQVYIRHIISEKVNRVTTFSTRQLVLLHSDTILTPADEPTVTLKTPLHSIPLSSTLLSSTPHDRVSFVDTHSWQAYSSILYSSPPSSLIQLNRQPIRIAEKSEFLMSVFVNPHLFAINAFFPECVCGLLNIVYLKSEMS